MQTEHRNKNSMEVSEISTRVYPSDSAASFYHISVDISWVSSKKKAIEMEQAIRRAFYSSRSFSVTAKGKIKP